MIRRPLFLGTLGFCGAILISYFLGKTAALGVLGLLAALLAWVLLSPASAVLLAGEEGEGQSMRNDRLGLLAGLYSAARESALAEPDS